MLNNSNNPSPVAELETVDPGDEMQRNVRYQHACGVILLVAAVREAEPYTYLWCEQHEDFLAERSDGLFDAIQVKTATPENGEWTLTKDALKNSIKRFIEFDKRFPGKIARFFFVSNVRCSKSRAQEKVAHSPLVLLECLKGSQSYDDLEDTARHGFDKLQEHCGCDKNNLFNVLKKLHLIKTPDRDNFESVISHDHIAKLPGCASYPASELNGLRDELIHRVYAASSLKSDDPAKDWYCLSHPDAFDPFLAGKKISINDVLEIIRSRHKTPFRYMPEGNDVNWGSFNDNIPIFEAKMLKGGLSSQIKSMRRRALSAEYHLMELAHMLSAERSDELFNQVNGVVKSECDEALLAASELPEPFGPAMLNDVYRRLRTTATERPDMVHNQEYECLVGVAGILTGECEVWWSHEFPLDVNS